MLLVRELMYCKPGKVKPMVEKFLAMNKLGPKVGMPPMKIMTDLSAERFWMLVAEMEVPDLKTFEEIFAGDAPTQDPEVAKPFNETKKYVVSRTPKELTWQNSALITGDVVPQLRKLKEDDAADLWVHGSGNLIQTLLANDLVDRMHLWTFPVLLGSGKRLFADGIPAAEWKLADSTIATSGVVIATYEPSGEIRKASFGE